MKKMKKLISLLLAFVMVIGLVPFQALADDVPYAYSSVNTSTNPYEYRVEDGHHWAVVEEAGASVYFKIPSTEEGEFEFTAEDHANGYDVYLEYVVYDATQEVISTGTMESPLKEPLYLEDDGRVTFNVKFADPEVTGDIFVQVAPVVNTSDPQIIDSGAFGENDSLNWALYDNGILYIMAPNLGTAMPDFTSASEQPWYEYRDQIYSIGISAAISSIGDYAFAGTSAFEASFTNNEKLESIGEYAFADCHSLKSVSFCNGITLIENYAFAGCGTEEDDEGNSGLRLEFETEAPLFTQSTFVGTSAHIFYQGGSDENWDIQKELSYDNANVYWYDMNDEGSGDVVVTPGTPVDPDDTGSSEPGGNEVVIIDPIFADNATEIDDINDLPEAVLDQFYLTNAVKGGEDAWVQFTAPAADDYIFAGLAIGEDNILLEVFKTSDLNDGASPSPDDYVELPMTLEAGETVLIHTCWENPEICGEFQFAVAVKPEDIIVESTNAAPANQDNIDALPEIFADSENPNIARIANAGLSSYVKFTAPESGNYWIGGGNPEGGAPIKLRSFAFDADGNRSDKADIGDGNAPACRGSYSFEKGETVAIEVCYWDPTQTGDIFFYVQVDDGTVDENGFIIVAPNTFEIETDDVMDLPEAEFKKLYITTTETSGESVYLRFTAPEDGKYIFAAQDFKLEKEVFVRVADLVEKKFYGPESETMTEFPWDMEKGETVVMRVGYENEEDVGSFVYTVTTMEEIVVFESTNAQPEELPVIEGDTEYIANIKTVGESVWVAFDAPRVGKYRFIATCDGENIRPYISVSKNNAASSSTSYNFTEIIFDCDEAGRLLVEVAYNMNDAVTGEINFHVETPREDNSDVVIPADAMDKVFPDANFRNYILYYLDKNIDGGLSRQEIDMVADISCDGWDISDLSGINTFANLESLSAGGNNLTSLDLSGNTKLKFLWVAGNEFSALDLSALTELEGLYCFGNPNLTALDLSNNTKLTSLDCEDCALTTLDLSALTELEEVLVGQQRLDLDQDLFQYDQTWMLDIKNYVPAEDMDKIVYILDANGEELLCVAGMINFGDEMPTGFSYAYHVPVASNSEYQSLLMGVTVGEVNGGEGGEEDHPTGMYEFFSQDWKPTVDGVENLREIQAHKNNLAIIQDGGEAVYVQFTAPADGTYTLQASSVNELDQMFIGRYDPSNDTSAGEDGYLNVTAPVTLTEGQTIVIEVMFKDASTSGHINFNIYLNASACTECAEGNFLDGTGFLVNGELHLCVKNFPSAAFRAYLQQSGIDADNSGTLSDAECNAVELIDCSNWSVTSLSGIQHFRNLNTLNCTNSPLTSLDVSMLTKLETLACGYDYGHRRNTSLRVPTSLQWLDCHNMKLAEPLNLDGLTDLTYLDINNNNNHGQNSNFEVIGLTAQNLPKLTHLDYGNCQLDIDFAQFTGLTYLSLYANNLKTLDVSMLPELEYLNFGENWLTYLDLSNNEKLTKQDDVYTGIQQIPEFIANSVQPCAGEEAGNWKVNLSAYVPEGYQCFIDEGTVRNQDNETPLAILDGWAHFTNVEEPRGFTYKCIVKAASPDAAVAGWEMPVFVGEIDPGMFEEGPGGEEPDGPSEPEENYPPLEEMPVLTLDETVTAVIENDGGSCWYQFTPEETGYYTFQSHVDKDTYGELYLYEDGEFTELQSDDDGGENNNFMLADQLEAGKTYAFKVRYLNDDVGQINVILERPNYDITFDIDSPVYATWETIFGEDGAYQEYDYLRNMTGTITINGTECDLSWGGFSYNNIWYELWTEDNKAGWTPGNDYTATVGWVGSSTEITVKTLVGETLLPDVNEMAELQLNQSVNAQPSHDSVWFTFTPDQDDVYLLRTDSQNNKPDVTLYRCHEDGSATGVAYGGWEAKDGNTAMTCKLTKGTKYAFAVLCYPDEGAVDAYPVTLTKSDIVDVTFPEVTDVYFETLGELHEDEHGDEYWNYYYWMEKLSYDVILRDGTTLQGSGNEFQYGDYRLPINRDKMKGKFRWELGNTYPVELTVMGQPCTVNVRVVKPEASLILNSPIETTHMDEWYGYLYEGNISGTITVNGTECAIERGMFTYEGVDYTLYTEDSQYNTGWEEGNTYPVTVRIMGKTAQIQVMVKADTSRWADEFAFNPACDESCGSSTTELLHICAHNFPDDTFREYFVRDYDRDYDGYLTRAEAGMVEEMWCTYNSITNLEGVQHFTRLTELYCYGNNLTQLDISKLTNLKCLNCSSNELSSLNLSNLTSLEELYCNSNEISTLDVSNLTSLKELHCSSNKISTLDVSNLTSLESLDCSYNMISSLNVDNLVHLRNLSCYNNKISVLDVYNLTELAYLSCSYNAISELDVSELESLYWLECERNMITELDVSKLTELEELHCGYNMISELDISNCEKLERLHCEYNDLTQLDVSNCQKLLALVVAGNPLTALDVTNNTELTYLNYSYTGLDVAFARLEKLEDLTCEGNGLISLDVSMLSNLEILNAANNKLTQINLEDNTKLRYVELQGNKLTQSDVSALAALYSLNVSRNPLTTLDISNNSELKNLYCQECQLTTLDLSHLELDNFNGQEQLVHVDQIITTVDENDPNRLCVDMNQFAFDDISRVSPFGDWDEWDPENGIVYYYADQIEEVGYRYDTHHNGWENNYSLYVTITTGCAHTWIAATCDTLETCSKCGETRGSYAHEWMDATCTTPKTCYKCGETVGDVVHNWQAATCQSDMYCPLCDTTIEDTQTDCKAGPWVTTETGMIRACIWCGEILERKEVDLPAGELTDLTDPSENAGNAKLGEYEGYDFEQILLTEEEQIAVENGAVAHVTLTVSDITQTVDPEDRERIEGYIGSDEKIGSYLDIELHKQVGTNDPTKISYIPISYVTVTIQIPEELLDVPQGMERNFFILRYHDGSVDSLSIMSKNLEKGFITFQTDRFSTYAIGYHDENYWNENDALGTQHNPILLENLGNHTVELTEENRENVYYYVVAPADGKITYQILTEVKDVDDDGENDTSFNAGMHNRTTGNYDYWNEDNNTWSMNVAAGDVIRVNVGIEANDPSYLDETEYVDFRLSFASDEFEYAMDGTSVLSKIREGDSTGLFYTWTAEEDGTVTFKQLAYLDAEPTILVENGDKSYTMPANGIMDVPVSAGDELVVQILAFEEHSEVESDDEGNTWINTWNEYLESTVLWLGKFAAVHTCSYEPEYFEPTCDKDGYTIYTCECGNWYMDVDEGSAIGHDYIDVVTEPTLTEKGFTTHVCTNCGHTYEDTLVDVLTAVAKIGDTAYATVADALAAAKFGETVIMLADSHEETANLTVDEGITLDLGAYDLHAKSLNVLTGGMVTATGYAGAANDHGKLYVPSASRLIMSGISVNGNTAQLIPVWDEVDHYVFGIAQLAQKNYNKHTTEENKITDEKVYFDFAPAFKGELRNDFFANDEGELLDNGIKIVLRVTWMSGDNVAQQDFVYGNTLAKNVANNSKTYCTFVLEGYAAMHLKLEDLQIVPMIVTDSGMILYGETFTCGVTEES